ncbi:helix-turn-helix domain-containing protein [Lactococcus cremoris]|uniref:helix-turn-helix domain-containing protein n=1 Tax=Lactococcus lactis subsp. cremoris TaxID=1359 RepID=UPI000BDF9411|nr:helix-turn-helix transcriptional regulator [Lactococcus cremoris]
MEYSIFYSRLKDLIDKSRKSFNQIERELGYPRNTLYNYKIGKKPSADRLVEIAEYFEVSASYLTGIDDTLTNKSIRTIFEDLTTEQKKELYQICHEWICSNLDDFK